MGLQGQHESARFQQSDLASRSGVGGDITVCVEIHYL